MKNLLILVAASLATAALATPSKPADPAAAPPPPVAGAHGAPAAPAKPVAKVAKATGPDAKTVAELVSGRAAAKDKPVTVKGQVVKVSSGILGKNWVHLQDGSGSAEAGTNDLVVTTADQPAVGQIVTVKGTVRTDVNIGSGYQYAVLVENAKFTK